MLTRSPRAFAASLACLLTLAACSELTPTSSVRSPEKAVRSLSDSIGSGGGATNNSSGGELEPCVQEGMTRQHVTGAQTCKDGFWVAGGGTVGSGN